MHTLEWFCSRGHTGSFEFASEIAAEIKGAFIRGTVCEVCGTGGLGVRITEAVEPAPAPEPEPVDQRSKSTAKA